MITFHCLLYGSQSDMVYFVGAGCGAVDLITIRGKKILNSAQIVIYAGSLINKDILMYTSEGCVLYDSSEMTLDQITAVFTEHRNKCCVRLHSGDPCLYGAIREQMEFLSYAGIPYKVIPGVSSFCGAAAALQAEYTVPGVSQSVIITRLSGRTPVPSDESLSKLAAHGCSMVIFLSTSLITRVQEELLKSGGYTPETPAAIVYKATWQDQKICKCTIETLSQTAQLQGITRTALILVGNFMGSEYEFSRLYADDFSTGVRPAVQVIPTRINKAIPQKFSCVYISALTQTGSSLAVKLTQILSNTGANTICTIKPENLEAWFEKGFITDGKTRNAIVFIGAAGIAVRHIAPFIRSKMSDPAVLVIDEKGHFCIPLLSGHIGGANDFARYIADAINAVPVITTATDIQGTWAVDVWANEHDMTISNPDMIKRISTAVLEHKQIAIYTDTFAIEQLQIPYQNIRYTAPEQADIIISRSGKQIKENALCLIPHDVILGIGCKKNIRPSIVQEAFLQFCNDTGLSSASFYKVCSINLKSDETAIIKLCKQYQYKFQTFTPEQLNSIQGNFSCSDFVLDVTGVDSVCERSAAAGAVYNAEVLLKYTYKMLALKHCYKGLTFAAACRINTDNLQD